MSADTRLSPQGCNPEGRCPLCGDDASVGRIVAIDDAARTAVVQLGSGITSVALDLVDAGVGDDVLVHMGFAIERLRPA